MLGYQRRANMRAVLSACLPNDCSKPQCEPRAIGSEGRKETFASSSADIGVSKTVGKPKENSLG